MWLDHRKPVINFASPYRFTGKQLDEESGLYYFGARYLDPKYSRWMSTDPALNEYVSGSKAGGGIGNTFNFHLYNYGNNNPVKYKDPDGRTPQDLHTAGGGGRSINYDYDREQERNTEGFHNFLDIAGCIPGIGEFADGLNAIVYVCEGDYSNAALSAVSLIPAIGDAVGKGGKVVRQGSKILSPKIGRKLEYVFGNATGPKHNIERSIDMEKRLNEIGVFDNAKGRAFMENELQKVFSNAEGVIQENGRELKQSLLVGPDGIAKMETVWEDDKLITIEIFKTDWKSYTE